MRATTWGYLLLLALAGLSGLGVGSWAGQQGPLRELAELRAEVAQDKAAQAETDRLAALAATRQLQQAQQRGDALVGEVTALERRNARLAMERRDAMARATTGTPCFGPAALQLLDGAPGLRVDRLPAAAGGAAGADGAATAAASDRDLGPWVLRAGELYEQCRARIDALRRWHADPMANVKGPRP